MFSNIYRKSLAFHCTTNGFGKQRIWSHLLKKSFMENFLFCALSDLYASCSLQYALPKSREKCLPMAKLSEEQNF